MNKTFFRHLTLIFVFCFTILSNNIFLYASPNQTGTSKPTDVEAPKAMAATTVTPTATPTVTPTVTQPATPTPYIEAPHFVDCNEDFTVSVPNIEEDSGVSKIVFYIDNEKIGEATSWPFKATCRTHNSSGTFEEFPLYANIYDSEGNMIGSTSTMIIVHEPTPTATRTPGTTHTPTPTSTPNIQSFLEIELPGAYDEASPLIACDNNFIVSVPNIEDSRVSKIVFSIDGKKIGEATNKPFIATCRTTNPFYGTVTDCVIDAYGYDSEGNQIAYGYKCIRTYHPTPTATHTATHTPTPTLTPTPTPHIQSFLRIELVPDTYLIACDEDFIVSVPDVEDSRVSKIVFYIDGKQIGEAINKTNKPFKAVCRTTNPFHGTITECYIDAYGYDSEGTKIAYGYKGIRTHHPTPTSTPNTPKLVEGRVVCDLKTDPYYVDKSGFKVELLGANICQVTDRTGCFGLFQRETEIDGNYTIRISRNNCITREITNVSLSKGKVLDLGSYIMMILGDIEINGVQDGAINMVDVIQVAKYFNQSRFGPEWDEKVDLNMDGVINLKDIMIISRNFGKTANSYSI